VTSRSGDLVLTPLAAHEVDDYHRLFSSPQVCAHWDRAPFVHRAEAVTFVEEALVAAAHRRQYRYSLYHRGVFAGTVCFYGFYWHQRRATLGYALAEEFWGQGLMTAALGLTLDLARGLGLHRLQALVLPDHRASARVLEKAGFTREGTLRDYEFWPGRGFVDLDLYAILFVG